VAPGRQLFQAIGLSLHPSPFSIAPPEWPDYRPLGEFPDTNRQARATYTDHFMARS
jgi:hypothetical protein